jgi:hypothetical protein
VQVGQPERGRVFFRRQSRVADHGSRAMHMSTVGRDSRGVKVRCGAKRTGTGANRSLTRIAAHAHPVPRRVSTEAVVRKIYSVYNDSPALPRKVILVLSDADLLTMIEGRVAGQSPTSHVQGLYRSVRSRVQ